MKNQLIKHILQYTQPSVDELNVFADAFTCQEVKKKGFVLQEGQYCKHVYFITKGCFRLYFINKKGVEKIINFGVDNWWITDYDSLLNNQASKINIQALEDSSVLKIGKSQLDQLLKQSLALNQYFRIIQEKVRVADQRRINYLFNLSGEEIYTIFRKHNPEFIQRVPQYMLASFLGFTPEFLSKVRAMKK